MKHHSIKTCLLATVLALGAGIVRTSADGTEELGLSYSDDASYILVSGVGTKGPPAGDGIFELAIPAGVSIKQVFLYWTGRLEYADEGPASTSFDLFSLDEFDAVQDTIPVSGDLIGGNDEVNFFAGDFRRGVVYRSDVTGLGLLSPGNTGRFRIDTDSVVPTQKIVNDGVAIVAVIENGSDGTVEIYDGRDWIFAEDVDLTAYQESTPITWSFAPSDEIRLLSLCLMAADIQRITDVVRPNMVEVTFDVGAPIVLFPGFDETSHVGPEFDILKLDNIQVPAGASQVTVSVSSVSYEDENSDLQPASFNWMFAGFVLDEMPDSEECGECDGKVTDLVFKYEGDLVDPEIVVDSKRGSSNLDVPVVPMVGDNLYFIQGPNEGNGGFYGTLGTEIFIYVNGELNAQFHTSCSQPIGPGLKHGDILIIEGTSKNGGALCPVEDDPETPEDPADCECEGKVSFLELEYTGPAIDGDVAFMQKKGNDTFFSTVSLSPGGGYLVSPASGQDTLGTDLLIVLIKNNTITPLAQFHTSCSQPIGPGASSGDFAVVGGTSSEGGELCELDEPYVHELNISKFHIETQSSTQSATSATTSKKTQKRGRK